VFPRTSTPSRKNHDGTRAAFRARADAVPSAMDDRIRAPYTSKEVEVTLRLIGWHRQEEFG
jgi:hypothetical protein